MIRLHR